MISVYSVISISNRIEDSGVISFRKDPRGAGAPRRIGRDVLVVCLVSEYGKPVHSSDQCT